MADMLPMIHAERRSLAEFLDTISPEQWTTPTWCDKWNVQDLVGHLTAAGHITAPHFFGGFIRTGFNFDKFVEGDLRRYAKGTRPRSDRVTTRSSRAIAHRPDRRTSRSARSWCTAKTSAARSARAAIIPRSTSRPSPRCIRRRAHRSERRNGSSA